MTDLITRLHSSDDPDKQEAAQRMNSILVALRARPASRRGPFAVSDEELDKELGKRGIDWRTERIKELQAEIDRLSAELENNND